MSEPLSGLLCFRGEIHGSSLDPETSRECQQGAAAKQMQKNKERLRAELFFPLSVAFHQHHYLQLFSL